MFCRPIKGLGLIYPTRVYKYLVPTGLSDKLLNPCQRYLQ